MASRTELLMKQKCFNFLLLFWIAGVLGGMWGCASRNVPHSHMGELYVETISSSRAYLSHINVRQEGLELIISGEVRRRNTAFSGKGHVDMAVISPAGMVLCQANTSYIPGTLPKTPGARKHRPSRFEVYLNCIPPRGSILRVAYHGAPDSDDPQLDGEDNYAVPKEHDHGG
ncbi:MAG: hypothetical protein GY846_26695 [Deltaproteobacteria bacterium]|nr:hypothetical protein [Deltaproteobacteria bacterium]